MKLSEFAKKHTTLSPLMSGREKLTTDDMLGRTIKVVAYDWLTLGDKAPFVIIVPAENNASYFYFGGKIMSELFASMEAEYTADGLSMALSEEGLIIRFDEKLTQSSQNKGQSYLGFEILDEMTEEG